MNDRAIELCELQIGLEGVSEFDLEDYNFSRPKKYPISNANVRPKIIMVTEWKIGNKELILIQKPIINSALIPQPLSLAALPRPGKLECIIKVEPHTLRRL
jgi:hypothetical protein